MLKLRILSPARLTDDVIGVFENEAAVSGLSVAKGAAIRPVGDVIVADMPREVVNDVIERLRDLGVHRAGTIEIQHVETWLSSDGFNAELTAPGSSADAVVWADVAQRSYEESELNWTYLSFMSLATLIAAIAIVLDSQILVIGAMVLGPEFGAIAALGVALVRHRYSLLGHAARTLALGFAAAIAFTTVVALLGRAVGWITADDVVGPRPATDFIYSPDKWSFIVAVIAGTAGVLSLTSARSGGLAGVFISVTTVPAAGNIALGIAFGAGYEIWPSALQLLVNICGMAVAGWAALALQQFVWSRVSIRRTKAMTRHRRML
ncbi:MAG: hypothetical protein QG655_702 [Actinomycetota bacterium]|jgi:uncharacterized hydrophobic protein (TIGR00271 family)|nr:hypothetical protein [Actinomycetota bacterium]